MYIYKHTLAYEKLGSREKAEETKLKKKAPAVIAPADDPAGRLLYPANGTRSGVITHRFYTRITVCHWLFLAYAADDSCAISTCSFAVCFGAVSSPRTRREWY